MKCSTKRRTNKKCETFSGNFHMYGWLKGMNGYPFWLSEKSPNIEIDDGLVNLWLIMMGMGLCRVWHVPPLAPAPPNHTQPNPIYRTTCTITPPITPSNTDTITNTAPGNANKTSTIHLWLKMLIHAHSFINFWLHKPCHTQHNPYPSSVIINSSHHRQFCALRDFSLSQHRQPILAQPNFYTLYKSVHCSPKHKLFSDFCVCHNDRWDLQPHIHMKISKNVSQFLFGRLFISVIINSSHHRQFCALRDFSLSQHRQPILAQPNFYTLYKSVHCSPKHKLFSDFCVCHNDRWDLQPHIHMKFPKNVSQFYLADYSFHFFFIFIYCFCMVKSNTIKMNKSNMNIRWEQIQYI